VYDWRQEQEVALRAAKGTGMTDEQVIEFVNGCESNVIAMLLPVCAGRVVVKLTECAKQITHAMNSIVLP
jgi:pantothenate kinase-related protein Tda10